MKTLISALIRDEQGASAVEMGLICALIVLAMLTALQNFAEETQATWNTVSTSTHNAVAGATAA
jgi:pilus assembly protein Flp/PilA